MSVLDKIQHLEARLIDKKEIVLAVVDHLNQNSIDTYRKLILHSESVAHSVIVCVLEFNTGESTDEIHEQLEGQGRV